MAFNGSGVYVLPAADTPAVANTLIESTKYNNVNTDLATALSTAILKDGQQTVTANIPFGGFKLTGVGAATARTDAATLASIQDGTGVYVATVGGTADVITLTPSPAITAYAAGQTFRFISSGANTTNVTVNISGLGAKAVTKNGTTALAANDIPSGNIVSITYDGTRFQLGTVGAATIPTGALPLVGGTMTGDITMSGASIFDANASVAAHATTMDPWSLGNYVTCTGTAVTFTGMANAPQAGAEAELYMNAAHTFTDGAVFEVDGDANYTATIGDRVLIRAKSPTVFTVHPRKKDGTAVVSGVSAGAVLQVLSTTKTDTFTWASTTLADITGFTRAITPAATANKVLIKVDLQCSFNGATGTTANFQLFRDTTAICQGDAAGSRSRYSASIGAHSADEIDGVSFKFLDSPSTTSAVTYKVQVNGSSAANGYINRSATDTDSAAFSRTVSTITCFEVKG